MISIRHLCVILGGLYRHSIGYDDEDKKNHFRAGYEGITKPTDRMKKSEVNRPKQRLYKGSFAQPRFPGTISTWYLLDFNALSLLDQRRPFAICHCNITESDSSLATSGENRWSRLSRQVRIIQDSLDSTHILLIFKLRDHLGYEQPISTPSKRFV